MDLWGSVEEKNKEEISSLCFPVGEISNTDAEFNVDHFVATYKREFGFEKLTNDLVLYLNKLVSDMLFLIDNDYAEFVHLCQRMIVIGDPVHKCIALNDKVWTAVRNVCDDISQSKKALDECLRKKIELKQKQHCLRFLITAHEVVENLNKQISKVENIDHIIPLFITLSDIRVLDAELDKEMAITREKVIDFIKTLFIRNMENNNINNLAQLIKKLTAISLFDEVCEKIRENYVIPIFNEMVNFDCATEVKLSDVYSSMLNLICERFSVLKHCDRLAENKNGSSCVRSLVWRSLETCIELYVDKLKINSGASELFYRTYVDTQKFINRFQQWYQNDDGFLLSLDSEAIFSKWNVKFYYNNIMKQLSAVLEKAFLTPSKRTEDGKKPRLVFTERFIQCCSVCWSEGVYASGFDGALSRLFLKLLSRFHQWLKETINFECNSNNLLLDIHFDLSYINECLLEQTEKRSIFPFVKKRLEFLLETKTVLKAKYRKWLISDNALSKIGDLPRLYLRTNRQSPSSCSSYVDESVYRVTSNYDYITKSLSDKESDQLVAQAFVDIASLFYDTAFEMLESVRKVDESLKKIRRSRHDRSSNVVNSEGDYEKIHKQIILDIEHFKEVCMFYTNSSLLSKMLEKLATLK